MLVAPVAGRIRERQPGSVILSVHDQCHRIALLLINQKNDQLTIAVIRSMMWTGAIGMSVPGDLQVKRLNDAKTGSGQSLVDPGLDLLAMLVEGQKGK
jgi:hypothetical protein